MEMKRERPLKALPQIISIKTALRFGSDDRQLLPRSILKEQSPLLFFIKPLAVSQCSVRSCLIFVHLIFGNKAAITRN